MKKLNVGMGEKRGGEESKGKSLPMIYQQNCQPTDWLIG